MKNDEQTKWNNKKKVIVVHLLVATPPFVFEFFKTPIDTPLQAGFQLNLKINLKVKSYS